MSSTPLRDGWLTPCAKRVARTSGEGVVCSARITPGHELHVDGGGFGVPQPLAACEQLLERATGAGSSMSCRRPEQFSTAILSRIAVIS